MIDAKERMKAVTEKLLERFGPRLLFVGLQGSYRRGEATEKSDFDVMVVLDELSMQDLQAYRELLRALPDAEKSCGFISGREELRQWPKFEIFQLSRETAPYYGSLDGLLPQITDEDVWASVRIAASGLYHLACHLCVHDSAEVAVAALGGAYKGAFFILQLLHYLRTGEYLDTKQALLPHLENEEKWILQTALRWKEITDEAGKDPDRYIAPLMEWSGKILRE